MYSSVPRRPIAVASAPPASEPSGAAATVKKRIVAVIRPSSRSGVIACRSAR